MKYLPGIVFFIGGVTSVVIYYLRLHYVLKKNNVSLANTFEDNELRKRVRKEVGKFKPLIWLVFFCSIVISIIIALFNSQQ